MLSFDQKFYDGCCGWIEIDYLDGLAVLKNVMF